MEKNTLKINNTTLDDILSTDKLVLLDFWADWCNYCKVLMPTINELEQKYEGKINIIKVDIDEYQYIASKYNVQSVPTVIFFKNGNLIHTTVGAKTFSTYEQVIEDNI